MLSKWFAYFIFNRQRLSQFSTAYYELEWATPADRCTYVRGQSLDARCTGQWETLVRPANYQILRPGQKLAARPTFSVVINCSKGNSRLTIFNQPAVCVRSITRPRWRACLNVQSRRRRRLMVFICLAFRAWHILSRACFLLMGIECRCTHT